MPNWCSNNITITGDVDKIKTIADILNGLGDKNPVFVSLIDNEPNADPNDWYEHNIRRFGTKWDVNIDESNIQIGEDCITMSPSTAWGPPVAFCITLAEKYDVTVEISYFEPGSDFAGKVTVRDGNLIEDEYTYMEGLFILDNEAFWYDLEQFYFPTDYEGTPEEYIAKEFSYLNSEDRDTAVEIYKNFLLDQEDETGE